MVDPCSSHLAEVNPTKTMASNEPTIATCDTLLRGELAAIETYSQAIHKFPDAAQLECLHHIRKDHLTSATTLRKLVTDAGGNPSTESGLWGDFAMVLEAGAALIGESPALAILKRGEQHGVSEYQAALANPEVSDAAKIIIGNELLPPLREHLMELDRIN
jgi:demethoxyubiquinone hydroxylase (CLK1/Coq7/Cat5 family)